MTFRIGLVQCKHPENRTVLDMVDAWAEKARSENVDILIFPESLMTRFEESEKRFLEAAQELDGAFATAMDEIAKDHGLWIVYTMNECNPEAGKPFNTAVLCDNAGNKQGVYRKVHLFDSKTVKESEKMSASDALFKPARTPFGSIGLGICYDLRFPEYAREQALQGAEVLIYPAAWVDGPNKAMQWRALLRARAIENELFVAGICRSDEGYVGESYVFGPDGVELAASAPHGEELVIADVDLDRIREIRSMIPVFDHRRTDLY